MDPKTILIVEDEPDILKTLTVFLESEGFKVITARDGIAGVDMVREKIPDLVILDLMLPKLDGFKVCRILKFDENLSSIPVIMFTARAQESDRKLGQEVGANVYIAKPFDPEVLLLKIKELIK